METGTASFRFVTVAVLATLGWSLWVMCTDGMAHDGMVADVAVDAFQYKPSVMEAGVAAGVECLLSDSDCCTMTKPFLTLGKSAAPRPELAATPVPGSCLLTAQLFSFYDSGGPNGESPPGITGSTYLKTSVLRI